MTTATERVWTFDTPDWEERLLAGKYPVDLAPVIPHLNQARIDAAMEFMSHIRLHDVPGQPLLLENSPQFLIDTIKLLAGSLYKDGDNFVQRIDEVLLCVAKKNAKTSFAAVLLLTLMAISPRPRAEFLFLAPRVDTAILAFQAVVGAILASPELKDRFEIREHIKQVRDKLSGNILRVKHFEMRAVTGTKPAAALLDEVWLLDPLEAVRVFAQLRGGTASIPEAQILLTTTHSDKAPVGFWKTKLDEARGVRDGINPQPGLLPLIFEPPARLLKDIRTAKTPRVKEILRCSNPSLGYSVREEWLLDEYTKKARLGGQELAIFCSQHLNAESTFTGTGDAGWIGAKYLQQAQYPDAISLDSLLEDAGRIVVGLDSGGLADMTAIVVLGEMDGSWVAWTRCWLAPDGVELQKSIAGDLKAFELMGDLVIAEPGKDVDECTDLMEKVLELAGDRFTGIGLDPAHNAAAFADAFEEAGVDPGCIFGIKQGWSLKPAYSALERRLAAGRMYHAGQPILLWCAANAQQNAGGLVTKASSPRKIDALVALATAVQVMAVSPEPFEFEVGALIG